jgi:class 3 adenylate cyclase/tetratricopeptide (TPR) repeat protein
MTKRSHSSQRTTQAVATEPSGSPPAGEHPSAATAYVSPLILKALSTDPGRALPWIEEVEGTLVMVDISGFTRLSERLAASGKEGSEILTDIINWYFQQMLDIARNYRGSNLKFGGDALLLFFQGLAHEKRAVQTALEMQRANRGFSAFRAGPDKVRLRMSIGVHSGRFWSCAVGDPDRRLQHIVFGDNVNKVALAEAEAGAGEVLISVETLAGIDVPTTSTPRGEHHRVTRLHRPPVPDPADEGAVADNQRLLPYLPPPLISALENDQRDIGAEHRRVVVLFVHLMGLEELAQKSGSGGALRQLQQYTYSLVDLTRKYGGFLAANDIYNEGVKFIVVFGAPVAREDDSANALRLAAGLRDKLNRSDLSLKQRIGVNAGFVFAGAVGATHRREYTVMGDAVNLSARLMSAASPGQVLVSKATMDEADAPFTARELAPIRVKGKRAEIPLVELGHESAATKVSQIVELVGRENELEILRNTCLEAEDGERRTVAILGEAGIGKSRLSLEFRQYLETRGWNVHLAQCYSHTSGNFFEPWSQLLRSYLRLDASDPEPIHRQQLMDLLQERLPKALPIAPLFNGLLGLSVPETDVVAALDEETKRSRLFDLVAELFHDASDRSRIALFIEDIDHADEASVELLAHLHERLAGSGLIICVSYRPREDGKPNVPEGSVFLRLQELRGQALGRLVRAFLGSRTPEMVLSAITERAKGNPLFVQEVSRSISGSEELQRALREGSAVRLEALIPDRLQTLMMSRIDRLSVGVRDALRAASVIGNRFETEMLAAVLAVPPEDAGIRRSLQALEEEEILDAERNSRTMTFRHSLIQEVAYESLPYARRRRMHTSVARFVEESRHDDLETYYGFLAHHYDSGGESQKTFTYSVKAGDKARSVFANEEAIRFYRRATSLSSAVDASSSDIVDLNASLGDVFELTARHDEAIRAYARGIENCLGRRLRIRAGTTPRPRIAHEAIRSRPEDLRRRISDLCRKIAYACDRLSEYEVALDWFRQALAALPRRAAAERGVCCLGLAAMLYRGGAYDEATSWARKGLRLTARGGIDPELAHAHNLLGVIYRDAGHAKRAITHRHEALDMYRQLGDRIGQADTLNNLGLDHLAIGEWEDAADDFEACIEIADDIGDIDLLSYLHNNLGEVYMCQGKFAEAKPEFRSTIEIASELGNIAVASLAEANLGEVLTLEGRTTAGREHLQRSLQAFRRIGAQSFLADVQIRIGETHVADGEFDQAYSLAERGLRAGRSLGSLPLEGRALHLMGVTQGKRCKWEAAETSLKDASAIFTRIGDRYREAKARAALAEVYVAQGVQRGAAAEAKKALSTFARLGAVHDLERTQQLVEGSRIGVG